MRCKKPWKGPRRSHRRSAVMPHFGERAPQVGRASAGHPVARGREPGGHIFSWREWGPAFDLSSGQKLVQIFQHDEE